MIGSCRKCYTSAVELTIDKVTGHAVCENCKESQIIN